MGVSHIHRIGVGAVPPFRPGQIVIRQVTFVGGKSQIAQHLAAAGDLAAVGQLWVLQNLGNGQQYRFHPKDRLSVHKYSRVLFQNCIKFLGEREVLLQ